MENIFCALKMRDLTELTDFSKSPLTLKAKDLKTEMLEKLKEENLALDKLLIGLRLDMKSTLTNVIRMERAVSVSARPGAINYRQTLPNKSEVDRVRELTGIVTKCQKDMETLSRDAQDLEDMERRRLNTRKDVSTQAEWFKAYGMPRRSIRKEERFMSIPNLKLMHIPAATSKDGKVHFEYQKSEAYTLRKGRLTN